MTVLFTADLHFTDRPQDEYRWGLFDWLAEQAVQQAVDAIVVLGDVTDAKDGHRARFVNRLVERFRFLAKNCPVYVLMGNHDYTSPSTPFFGFLHDPDRNIHYIKEPQSIVLPDKSVALMIPNTDDIERDWLKFKGDYDYILLHQCFDGVTLSDGYQLSGPDPKIFKDSSARILSGDIHVQQKVGKVEYVGAPYRIRFGDVYEGRCLLIDGEEEESLHYPCLRKHTVVVHNAQELFDNDELAEGDQVKVRLMLKREEMVEWADRRREVFDVCNKLGVSVHGVELAPQSKRTRIKKHKKGATMSINAGPEEVLVKFAKRENIDAELLEVGKELLKE